MTRDFDLIQLANAVQWWMSYTSAVGRSYVLAESSIKYPLAEYLERTNPEKIKLEYNHPKLEKRRVDIYFKSSDNTETLIEFKFIKDKSTNSGDEKQRIFNDLMRLHLTLDNDKQCYFLICGSQADFINSFQSIVKKKYTNVNQYIQPYNTSKTIKKFIAKGFYTKWFSFNINDAEKIIKIKGSYVSKEHKEYYNGFEKEYSESFKNKTGNDLILPDKIKTKLLYLSKDIDNNNKFYQPSKIGIWKIEKEE